MSEDSDRSEDSEEETEEEETEGEEEDLGEDDDGEGDKEEEYFGENEEEQSEMVGNVESRATEEGNTRSGSPDSNLDRMQAPSRGTGDNISSTEPTHGMASRDLSYEAISRQNSHDLILGRISRANSVQSLADDGTFAGHVFTVSRRSSVADINDLPSAQHTPSQSVGFGLSNPPSRQGSEIGAGGMRRLSAADFGRSGSIASDMGDNASEVGSVVSSMSRRGSLRRGSLRGLLSSKMTTINAAKNVSLMQEEICDGTVPNILVMNTHEMVERFEQLKASFNFERTNVIAKAERTFPNTISPLMLAESRFLWERSRLELVALVSSNDSLRINSMDMLVSIRAFLLHQSSNAAVHKAVKEVSLQKLPTDQMALLKVILQQGRDAGLDLDEPRMAEYHQMRIKEQKLSYMINKEIQKCRDTAKISFTEQEMEGVPEWHLKILKKDESGSLFYVRVHQRRDTEAIMKYAKRESTRERLYTERSKRVPHQNVAIIRELTAIRKKAAETIGYASHAHMRLQKSMAEGPEKVIEFLGILADRSSQIAHSERESLLRRKVAFKDQRGEPYEDRLKPWDVEFYEALEMESGEIQDSVEEEAREYFPINYVIEDMISYFEERHGVKLHIQPNESTWNEDVVVLAIKDEKKEKNEQFLGYIFLDLFARKGKVGCEYDGTPSVRRVLMFRPLCSSFVSPDPRRKKTTVGMGNATAMALAAMGVRNMNVVSGVTTTTVEYEEQTYSTVPAVGVVLANFPKIIEINGGKAPYLLYLDEVCRLHHELEHAIHHLSARGQWGLTSGVTYHCGRDYVEMIGKAAEYHCKTEEFLTSMSTHYMDITKSMPSHLASRLLARVQSCAAMKLRRELISALFDILLHHPSITLSPSVLFDRLYSRFALEEEDKVIGNPVALFSPVVEGNDCEMYTKLWAAVYGYELYTATNGDDKMSNRLRTELMRAGINGDAVGGIRKFLGRWPTLSPYLKYISVSQEDSPEPISLNEKTPEILVSKWIFKQ